MIVTGLVFLIQNQLSTYPGTILLSFHEFSVSFTPISSLFWLVDKDFYYFRIFTNIIMLNQSKISNTSLFLFVTI